MKNSTFLIIQVWLLVIASLGIVISSTAQQGSAVAAPCNPPRCQDLENQSCSRSNSFCKWREESQWTAFEHRCSGVSHNCPGRADGRNQCNHRELWLVTYRTYRCVTGNPPSPCDGVSTTKTECLRANGSSPTNTDCSGKPCPNSVDPVHPAH